MNSTKKTARIAGLLYLVWVITGIFGLIYVPSRIMARGDAAATVSNILANEFLFRTYIINDLLSITIGVFLIFVLYGLLKQVNEHQAKLMVALLIVTFPVAFIMDAFNIASLMIIKGEVLRTFELVQRQDLAMLFLKINDYGSLALEMFWGLWLFPLGFLVFRSGFLPRFVGIWLIINGFAYVVISFTGLLLPQLSEIVNKIFFPTLFGEVAFMLSLLIVGTKQKPLVDTASAAG